MTNTATHYCKRCGGSGFILAYRHIDGGRCFECADLIDHERSAAALRADALRAEHAAALALEAARTPEQIAADEAARAEEDRRIGEIDLVALFAEVEAELAAKAVA